MESQGEVQGAAGAAESSGVLHVTGLRDRPFCVRMGGGREGGWHGWW